MFLRTGTYGLTFNLLCTKLQDCLAFFFKLSDVFSCFFLAPKFSSTVSCLSGLSFKIRTTHALERYRFGPGKKGFNLLIVSCRNYMVKMVKYSKKIT